MENPDISSITPQSWRYAFRTLSVRNFRLFFIGQTISLIGTWSQMIAISWFVWRLTGSAWWLGFVGFASQVPVLLLGLFGGFVTDRYPRLPLLITTQVLCMLQAFLLALLAYFGRVELWQIIVLSVLLGVFYAFEFPLRQTFVMDMVGHKDLINAVSLTSAMFHATRVLGPVAAGFVIGLWGEPVCFAFNAVSFLFLIAALLIMNKAELNKQDSDDLPLFSSIKVGLNYMWSRWRVKAVLVTVTVASGIGMLYIPLLPLFVGKIYGGTALSLGWLVGASGIGSLLGALYLARRHVASGLFELIIRNLIIFSVFIIIFAWAKNKYIAMLVLSCAAFFLTMLFSSANTFLQQEVPNHLRGRMMSLFTITFFGLAPIGSIVGGAAAEVIGAPLTVMASGLACLLTGFVLHFHARKYAHNETDV